MIACETLIHGNQKSGGIKMKKVITTIAAAGITFMLAAGPALAASTDATGAAPKGDVKSAQPAVKTDADNAKVKDGDVTKDSKKAAKKKSAKKKSSKKAKAKKQNAAGDMGQSAPDMPQTK
jgi:hypothetical protein